MSDTYNRSTIELPINTAEKWSEIKSDLESDITNNQLQKGNTVIFNVIVEDDTVENLIYFFPIRDMLKSIGCKANLLVHTPEYLTEKETNHLINKIRHFLFLQQMESPSTFRVNNAAGYTQTRFGRIHPVLTVSNEEDSKYSIRKLYTSGSESNRFFKYKDFIRQSLVLGSSISKEDRKKLESILKEETELNVSELLEDIQNNKKELRWGKLFHIDKKDDLERILLKFSFSNFVRALKDLHGNSEVKIPAEIKKKIFTDILDRYFKLSESLSLLTQYIWSVILRYLIYSKALLNLIKNGKTTFFQSLFDTSLNYAQSISDGIFQIIENACLYSSSNNIYFYLRVHQTEIDNKNKSHEEYGELKKIAKTLLRLHTEYYRFKPDASNAFHLEVCLVDNAFDGGTRHGMKEHFEQTRGGTIKSLTDIFRYKPQNDEDWVIHYGLRIFERTVRINNGVFFVHTPSKESAVSGYSYLALAGTDSISFKKGDPVNSQSRDETDSATYYGGTVYKALIPISSNITHVSLSTNQKPLQLFDTSYIRKQIRTYKIDIVLDESIVSESIKFNRVRMISDRINHLIPQECRNDQTIICIRPVGFGIRYIELFAKAVVMFSRRLEVDDLKIALFMESKEQIIEFTRIYTAFFDISGEDYQNLSMKHTQIAMCRMHKDTDDPLPEVCYVLCGSHLGAAQRSVRNYLYYNAENCMEFVPVIDYLTGFFPSNQSKPGKKVDRFSKPIFPFDIYLDAKDFDSYDNSKYTVSEDNTWFITRIHSLLSKDMRVFSNGCKLDNIHISIGSKLHINTFYNADLLFHDYANVFRFAYLTASNILNEHLDSNKTSGMPPKSKIVIIAYGENSLILVQKICDIINDTANRLTSELKAYHIFFPSHFNDEEQREWQTQGREIRAFIEHHQMLKNNDLTDYVFYTVVPISSTLTTVRKIYDVTLRNFSIEGISGTPEFSVNHSLIVLYDKGKYHNDWESHDEKKKMITLKPDSPEAQEERIQRVRYTFLMEGKFGKAIKDECELCRADDDPSKDRKCLIGIDKDSLLPNVIFDTLSQKKSVFGLECIAPRDGLTYEEWHKECKDKNEERIRQLYNHVTYTHIADEKNHFQFDVNYESYCGVEEIADDIKDWLIKVVRKSIDSNAFNIIVSPLNAANSVFLKNVIENAFDNNSRLVNIRFNSSYRDEIRSKFSYITQEYHQLCSDVSGAKVHVYFVDNCIVEGTSLQRSRQLVNMLLSDSGFDMSITSLFHGIILLSNRSSYDTIHNLVSGEVSEKLFYYMRLNVPSFNTKSSICPACNTAQQYLLMNKRASTGKMALEYKRLQEKMAPKTKLEYEKWLETTFNEDFYRKIIFPWFYYAVFYVPENKDYYYLDFNGDIHPLFDHSVHFLELCRDDIQSILSGNSHQIKEFIKRIKKSSKLTRDIVWIYKKIILCGKDYARTICTHNIFVLHDEIHRTAVESESSPPKYYQDIRAGILWLIRSKLEEIDTRADASAYPKSILWLKSEWVVSYIKILARKQPSQYYAIRNAVFNIFSDILDGLLNKADKDDVRFIVDLCSYKVNKKPFDSFMPEMKYRIFLSIIRQLSALYSSYAIKKLSEIFRYYNDCLKQYRRDQSVVDLFENSQESADRYHNLVPFPDKNEFGFCMAKLIKWSSMYGADDSKCFIAETELRSIIEDPSFDDPDFIGAVKMAFLENTHVIYRGIKRMRVNRYQQNGFANFKEVYTYVDSEVTKTIDRDNEMNPNWPLAHFMDWKNERRNISDLSLVLSNMLMYFYTLCELEKRNTPITSPYTYVDVCNYIRKITRCEKCEIVSVKERKLITIVSSNVRAEYLLDRDLSDETVDLAINDYRRIIGKKSRDHKKEGQYLINSAVAKYKVGDDGHLFIIPLLDHAQKNDSICEQDFYLLIYNGLKFNCSVPEYEELSYHDLKDIRNILFLRNRLEIVLQRDMAYLHDMVKSYGYIRPLNENRKPLILHISDLHIKDEESCDYNQNLEYEKMKQEIDRWRFDESPDLLLITGDVITGDYKAATLQRSYQKASYFIKYLVKKIWTISDRINGDYIRSDWKKRILISTGNHDYASMNELEAHNRLRITTSGSPGALGDTMIKHSYFVNFIHSLLDIDIDDIVKNDLNSITHYEQLCFSVINLNTSSNVNPLRTNKVRVNEPEITKMVCHNDETHMVVYMMHHTPMYDINYLSDVYYLKDNIRNDVLDALVEVCGKTYAWEEVGINKVWLELIASLENNFKSPVRGMSPEQQKLLIKKILKIVKKNNPTDYIENKLDDIMYVVNCDDPDIDDKCRNVKYYLAERQYATKNDMTAYIDFAQKHFGEYTKDKVFYILGGHTHAAAIFNGKFHGSMSECLGIYEAGKFFDQSNDCYRLNYYLLSVEGNKSDVISGRINPIVSMCPEHPKQKSISECETLKRIMANPGNKGEDDKGTS